MQKLARFLILSLLFVLTFILFYALIPSIVWIFGGSFTAVSQDGIYAAFCTMILTPALGFLFAECFDDKFYPKR
jgi:hypothetical protein